MVEEVDLKEALGFSWEEASLLVDSELFEAGALEGQESVQRKSYSVDVQTQVTLVACLTPVQG